MRIAASMRRQLHWDSAIDSIARTYVPPAEIGINTMGPGRRALQRLVKKILAPMAKIGPIGKAAGHIHAYTRENGTYPYYRELFIKNGQVSSTNRQTRSEIVARFEEIDRRVPVASSQTDGLILAEAILSLKADGDIVECGCFAGASSAKLSILAKHVGKKLVVCDSFEGLPAGGERAVHARKSADELPHDWRSGDYSLGLEGVKNNITKFGEISGCSFVKGWFENTLKPENLPAQIAAAFTDVDLNSSARECLVRLWPLLSNQAVYFSHDVAFITVMQHLLDENLWKNELKSFPPIFFGAGFGVCDLSPHLGYMVKGSGVSAEYLKSLTLNKQ